MLIAVETKDKANFIVKPVVELTIKLIIKNSVVNDAAHTVERQS